MQYISRQKTTDNFWMNCIICIIKCNNNTSISRNSEAFASEFLENPEDRFFRYYMHNEVGSWHKSSTKLYCSADRVNLITKKQCLLIDSVWRTMDRTNTQNKHLTQRLKGRNWFESIWRKFWGILNSNVIF